MYWLIGISILTVMLGILSVAINVLLPNNDLFLSMDSTLYAPLLLVIITILLIFLNQPRALFWASASKVSSKPYHSILYFIIPAARYLLLTLLTLMLIGGSALQVLSSHQQAENTKISASMRVQALVAIEGVSDSVYDSATNSGYRQIATIQYLSPLISELTNQELDAKVLSYIKNSQSKNNDDIIEGVEYRVLLNAYPNQSSKSISLAGLNDLQPGDHLLMTLAIEPLVNSQDIINNPTGFDSYRWLRGRHIDGVANIIAISTPIGNLTNSSTPLSPTSIDSDTYFKRLRTHIDQWRWQLRQRFYQDWSTQTISQQQANAVTLSLLTGDRSLINRDTKDLYQLAGISHLLAISGTHVLFLAIMLAGLAVLLFNRICPLVYKYVPRWQLRWLVMISAAFVYALFTGFDVPAARTAWMLLAIGMVRFTLLPISTMRVLLALAVLMAWIDPYVLWQAGYWLSFVAVALLLKYDNASQNQVQSALSSMTAHLNQYQHSKKSMLYAKVWSLCQRVFKLQCWLFIALLPITLLLFGKTSLWGLVINLFAIGLFGWVIVPLNLLAGLFYLIVPSIADSLWSVVSAIVSRLHELISWLTALPAASNAWLYTSVNIAIILIAVLIMLPWLLPRGLISRLLALPPAALLAMTLYANQQGLLLTPTLYILPTGDRYLSAAILQYPIKDNKFDRNNQKNSADGSINWLFLADHRPSTTRTMPSSLTADKLSAILEQQLRTLSIKHLEGIVVQTSVTSLTDVVSVEKNGADITYELLPATVAQLTQRLPTNQYWQAGRHERWSSRQQLYSTAINANDNPKSTISAQDCVQGKTWQSANDDLSLQAITGWSKIEDSSVWDCTVAIDSTSPIRVLQYNAANPLQSLPLIEQASVSTVGISGQPQPNQQKKPLPSRLILDAATHQRVWQLWSLLCSAQPFAIDLDTGKPITWLSHSASQVSSDVLSKQKASTVLTYDSKPLDVALMLVDAP